MKHDLGVMKPTTPQTTQATSEAFAGISPRQRDLPVKKSSSEQVSGETDHPSPF
jgi:hypothetical protein